MQDRKQNFRFPLAWFAGVAGVILLVGTGTAWRAKYSLKKAERISTSQNPTVEAPQNSTITDQEPIAQQQEQVRVAWLDTTGTNIKLIDKSVTFSKSVDQQQLLESAFEQLMAGVAQSADYATAIPKDTKLLSIKASPEGVKLNLSSEFTQGGGSASMTARLAQVIYTASGLDNDVPVWISVEGKPLETLGGEGIIVSQPITRQEFQANFAL